MAPEILSCPLGGYTKAVDCWSLGVILYTCLAGTYPFNDQDDNKLKWLIAKGEYNFSPKHFDDTTGMGRFRWWRLAVKGWMKGWRGRAHG